MSRRLNVRLDDDLAALLERFSANPRTSQIAIVRDALRAYLTAGAAAQVDAMLTARLDRYGRQTARVERDLNVLTESFALFVRHYFIATPPIPQADQAAARALGEQRFAGFIDRVSRRMAQGRSLAAEVETRLRTDNPKVAEAAE